MTSIVCPIYYQIYGRRGASWFVKDPVEVFYNPTEVFAPEPDTQPIKRLETMLDKAHPKLVGIDGEEILLPDSVYQVLRQVTHMMAAGRTISLVPDGNQQEIQRWLREPLIEWRGSSPLDCLTSDKIDAVVNLVERIYYADSAGAKGK